MRQNQPKSMDMQFYSIRYWIKQYHFHILWKPGTEIWYIILPNTTGCSNTKKFGKYNSIQRLTQRNLLQGYFNYSQLQKSYVITTQALSPNMGVMSLPKHKTLRGNPQTNGIINGTHVHGAHNTQTEPNDSNYELGLP